MGDGPGAGRWSGVLVRARSWGHRVSPCPVLTAVPPPSTRFESAAGGKRPRQVLGPGRLLLLLGILAGACIAAVWAASPRGGEAVNPPRGGGAPRVPPTSPTRLATRPPAAAAVHSGGAAVATLARPQLDRAAPAPTALPPAPPPPVQAPPPHVGIQVGHWQIARLPPALVGLADQTGTAAAGRTELELNLDVAQRTAALLRRAGVLVDLLPATIPNGYRADAFVAVHADANFARPDRGYKVAPPYRSAVAWTDALLVAQLDAAYGAATGLPPDLGVTDNMRGYYAINGWMGDESRISVATPGAIIETGFMTSAADRAVLFDQPNRVAAGVAAGILGFLRAGTRPNAVQQRAQAVAATVPSGCSVVVLLDDVPVRAAPDPSAPVVAWVSRGAVLPYLDSTARPAGPLTPADGQRLAVETGYYRVGAPGGGPPGYINHAPVVVQVPVP